MSTPIFPTAATTQLATQDGYTLVRLSSDPSSRCIRILLIKGQLLPLDAGECMLMGMEVGDIRDDAGVLEVDQCVVNNKMGEMVRVEDAKVGVSGCHRGECKVPSDLRCDVHRVNMKWRERVEYERQQGCSSWQELSCPSPKARYQEQGFPLKRKAG